MVNVGEIVNDIQAVLTGGTLTFRPATGEQYILLSVGSNDHNLTNGQLELEYGLTNGTLTSYAWRQSTTDVFQFFLQKLGFTNTNYLVIHNTSSGTASISYSAIRVK